MRDELLKRAGIEEADLTEHDLAELEQLSVRTIREWRQKGTGPPYRKLGPGKMAPVRYPVSAYRAWRDGTVVTCTAQRARRPAT